MKSEKSFVKLYFMHFKQAIVFLMFLQYAIKFRLTGDKKLPINFENIFLRIKLLVQLW